MSGFSFYREIKLDQRMKICFLTVGEMYYGAYSDIFSSLPSNCFISKPITNEELLEHVNELLYGDGRENLSNSDL